MAMVAESAQWNSNERVSTSCAIRLTARAHIPHCTLVYLLRSFACLSAMVVVCRIPRTQRSADRISKCGEVSGAPCGVQSPSYRQAAYRVDCGVCLLTIDGNVTNGTRLLFDSTDLVTHRIQHRGSVANSVLQHNGKSAYSAMVHTGQRCLHSIIATIALTRLRLLRTSGGF